MQCLWSTPAGPAKNPDLEYNRYCHAGSTARHDSLSRPGPNSRFHRRLVESRSPVAVRTAPAGVLAFFSGGRKSSFHLPAPLREGHGARLERQPPHGGDPPCARHPDQLPLRAQRFRKTGHYDALASPGRVTTIRIFPPDGWSPPDHNPRVYFGRLPGWLPYNPAIRRETPVNPEHIKLREHEKRGSFRQYRRAAGFGLPGDRQ